MNLIEVILPGAASGKPVEGGVISASHAEEFLMMVGADCPASSSCTLNDFLLRADPICTEADGGAEADADAPGGQSFWMPVTPLPLPVPQAVTDDLDRGGQACPAMTLDRPAARRLGDRPGLPYQRCHQRFLDSRPSVYRVLLGKFLRITRSASSRRSVMPSLS